MIRASRSKAWQCWPEFVSCSFVTDLEGAGLHAAVRPSDFLWGLVGSTNLMRLSSQKAAHATVAGAAYRKSGELAHGNGFTCCGKILSMKGAGFSP
jgi:hypothetical protein